MTVCLHFLDHLAINFYSNIVAVLTDSVANGWDLDKLEQILEKLYE
jgi:hypothetical protein